MPYQPVFKQTKQTNNKQAAEYRTRVVWPQHTYTHLHTRTPTLGNIYYTLLLLFLLLNLCFNQTNKQKTEQQNIVFESRGQYARTHIYTDAHPH